jgi:Alpha/beta hydrolase domain
MFVPRTDSDGNELGGVPVVLRDAPLGSYFGWNITSAGFHKSQNCDYTGGYIPFAVTKQDRIQKGDPRPSIEERYGTHAGYVAAVKAAAANAVAKGFLLQADADALVAAAQASHVLN